MACFFEHGNELAVCQKTGRIFLPSEKLLAFQERFCCAEYLVSSSVSCLVNQSINKFVI